MAAPLGMVRYKYKYESHTTDGWRVVRVESGASIPHLHPELGLEPTAFLGCEVLSMLQPGAGGTRGSEVRPLVDVGRACVQKTEDRTARFGVSPTLGSCGGPGCGCGCGCGPKFSWKGREGKQEKKTRTEIGVASRSRSSSSRPLQVTCGLGGGCGRGRGDGMRARGSNNGMRYYSARKEATRGRTRTRKQERKKGGSRSRSRKLRRERATKEERKWRAKKAECGETWTRTRELKRAGKEEGVGWRRNVGGISRTVVDDTESKVTTLLQTGVQFTRWPLCDLGGDAPDDNKSEIWFWPPFRMRTRLIEGGRKETRLNRGPQSDIDDEEANNALTTQSLNPDGTPKRPMNAFMIFARRRRPQVSAENQSMRTGDISKILSQEWKAMLPGDKAFYLAQAKQLKETFNTRYPDYVYRRRPNNTRKRRPAPTSSSAHPHSRADTDDATEESSPDAETPPPLPDSHLHSARYPPQSAPPYDSRYPSSSYASSSMYGNGYGAYPSHSSSHHGGHVRTSSYPYPPSSSGPTDPYRYRTPSADLLNTAYYPPYDANANAPPLGSPNLGLRKAHSIPAGLGLPTPTAASPHPSAHHQHSNSASSSSYYAPHAHAHAHPATHSPPQRYSPYGAAASTPASTSTHSVSSSGSPVPAYSPAPAYTSATSSAGSPPAHQRESYGGNGNGNGNGGSPHMSYGSAPRSLLSNGGGGGLSLTNGHGHGHGHGLGGGGLSMGVGVGGGEDYGSYWRSDKML
ncbi:hypothetical protein K438DRAFT_1931773 [Mycena galopus ATCC 62051]|nr:hypothetical protein K438DRAFT_1931773 [Mycena galopus ATCC 62051]